jgi:Rad3-related DNA helicase
MTDNILNAWPIPEFEPRPIQRTALEWIEKSYPNTKYFFLQAPVGAGKSLIGMTAAEWMAAQSGMANTSYILTPQRILQKQYEDSFKKEILATLYGKSNYQCSSRNTTCDIGGVLRPPCQSCPYRTAKGKARTTKNSVLNYNIALLAFKYTTIFKPRPVIVLDECHTAEEYLTEIDAATISSFRAKKFDVKWQQHEHFSDAVKWTNETYLPKVDLYVSKLEDELAHIINNEFVEPTDAEVKKLRELIKTQEHVDVIREITLLPLDQINHLFVYVHDKETKKFKRLNGGYNFKRILDPYGEKFLFMSSTILNYKGFCRDLSIDPEQSAYIDLTSEFEPKNRPVFFMPQMKMNASWRKPENTNNRKKMAAKVLEVLEMHKEDSGIIHTGNFAIARWLVEELEFTTPQKIFHHNPESGDDRNKVIDAFQKHNKPAILISPSITEGLDLKDDLARFAIIVKVPFGFLGDQWIKKRLNLSKEWYNRRAMIDIIQGAGRIVRSKEDWGNTYILDESFRYLFMQVQDSVPQWWKDAYRVM